METKTTSAATLVQLLEALLLEHFVFRSFVYLSDKYILSLGAMNIQPHRETQVSLQKPVSCLQLSSSPEGHPMDFSWLAWQVVKTQCMTTECLFLDLSATAEADFIQILRLHSFADQ